MVRLSRNSMSDYYCLAGYIITIKHYEEIVTKKWQKQQETHKWMQPFLHILKDTG
jgi:hypothetical protein